MRPLAPFAAAGSFERRKAWSVLVDLDIASLIENAVVGGMRAAVVGEAVRPADDDPVTVHARARLRPVPGPGAAGTREGDAYCLGPITGPSPTFTYPAGGVPLCASV